MIVPLIDSGRPGAGRAAGGIGGATGWAGSDCRGGFAAKAADDATEAPRDGDGADLTNIGAGASRLGKLDAISVKGRVSSYAASALDQLASLQQR